MAITSELIGKLGGGAGVEVIPVSETAATNPLVLRRVTVQSGEKVLVAAVGSSPTMGTNDSYWPGLQVGGMLSRPAERYGTYSVVAAITQSTDVVLDRRGGSVHRADFEGTIYIAKL